MTPWGWQTERSEGIWRYGAKWYRSIVASFPWITLVLILMMLEMVSGTFTAEKGLLFDLPDTSLKEGETTKLVALVMPMSRETMVFFDDARYILGDDNSIAALREQFAVRTERDEKKTLLVLADRRVAGGELMKLADIAKKGGVKKLLFAEKKGGQTE